MSPSDQRIKYIRCIITFNRAACFRAARQSTPVEFDYSSTGIGVGVGDDHDDDVDESKASSRMLVFPSILVRSAESPDEDFDSTPPCIHRVARCILNLVAHGTRHPCSRLLARDSAISPSISSI